MKSSELDGKQIFYQDTAGLRHAGIIVGQSDDGEVVFVQADYELLDIEPSGSAWDWSIRRDWLNQTTII